MYYSFLFLFDVAQTSTDRNAVEVISCAVAAVPTAVALIIHIECQKLISGIVGTVELFTMQ